MTDLDIINNSCCGRIRSFPGTYVPAFGPNGEIHWIHKYTQLRKVRVQQFLIPLYK